MYLYKATFVMSVQVGTAYIVAANFGDAEKGAMLLDYAGITDADNGGVHTIECLGPAGEVLTIFDGEYLTPVSCE